MFLESPVAIWKAKKEKGKKEGKGCAQHGSQVTGRGSRNVDRQETARWRGRHEALGVGMSSQELREPEIAPNSKKPYVSEWEVWGHP